MNDQNTGNFEILSGYPADVVAISAIGRIDQTAYEKTLIPLFEETLKREGKVNILSVLGPDFKGITAGAAYEDAKFGLTHLSDFARFAVVTDIEWVRVAVNMFSPFMHKRMRLFQITELDAAKEWISTYKLEQGGPVKGADIDYSTLPLEERKPLR